MTLSEMLRVDLSDCLSEQSKDNRAQDAPGAPGISPTWASSAKDAVGSSLGPARLWFTIGYGIINEVYWPRVDLPQIRDLGFIVADGNGFWSEVKRGGKYSLKAIAPGTPAFEIDHRSCTELRYERFDLRQSLNPPSLTSSSSSGPSSANRARTRYPIHFSANPKARRISDSTSGPMCERRRS
ncbi:hypothetical protein [Bradyrhizobium sp. CSA112]|uniref:hypothetical protein n=1 Tax=Bradyrhizobium sp. CSA112 TaxID=2699170 RepID=UPI0023B029E1|nr:hypothetical protein [Bradyrhizobium sp. CSA112]